MRRRDDIDERIGLYLYNEMEPAARAKFEAEAACSEPLRAAIAEERRFLALLDERVEPAADEELLERCREDLTRAARRAESRSGIFGWRAAADRWGWSWRPAAALGLTALGFWLGRVTVLERASETPTAAPPALVDAVSSTAPEVRSVAVDPGGAGVEIVLEERRTVRGAPSDPRIRGLLISSAVNSDSAARLESVDLLRSPRSEPAARAALIRAMLEDSNPGVRLKAIEALAPLVDDAGVRRALAATLRRDANPGMRVRAIDLLAERPDRELGLLLREVLRTEANAYVRMRGQRILHQLDLAADDR